MKTSHMTGQSAKVAPLSIDWSAGITGICHGPTATPKATSRAPSPACQAGRRSTPSRMTSVAIGNTATQKEALRLPSMGVRS